MDAAGTLRITVSLLPELPRAGDTFQAKVEPYTPDSHPYLDYQWSLNAEELSGQRSETFLGRVARGDKVSVTVTPSDGGKTGPPVTVSRVVLNSSPMVEALERASFDGRRYQTRLKASDPDRDPLEFTLLEGPQGLVVDSQGWIRWQPSEQDMGKHQVAVSVKDDHGGEIIYTYQFSLGMTQGSPPTEQGP